MTSAEDRILKLYDAFNGRDFDSFFKMLAPDANWPHEIDGGRLIGHDAIRTYLFDETAALLATYEPLYLRPLADGRVAVLARQTITSAKDGTVWSNTHVRHIFTVEGDLVTRLEVEQSSDALAEAGDAAAHLLDRLHDGIERQDIEAVMAVFHPQARIPDNLEARDLSGLAEIRDYYLRQFAVIRISASALWLQRLSENSFEAIVQVQVRGADGGFWEDAPIKVDYRTRDDLIVEMGVAHSLTLKA